MTDEKKNEAAAAPEGEPAAKKQETEAEAAAPAAGDAPAANGTSAADAANGTSADAPNGTSAAVDKAADKADDTDKADDENAPAVIMVTGGSGLVGSAIKSYAEANPKPHETWIFLSSKDGDLRVRAETDAIFDEHKPTHVIHLAAKVGGLFANLAHKVEFYRENTLINDNIMECSRIHEVKKLVSMLSTCIFPDKTKYPIDETMLHDGPPHPSNEGYAYAKRLIDTMNRAYAEQYGCNFTSIIPTNIYGPHDNFSIQNGHVIPGLIHKCYLAKKNETDFTIWGSGTPLRQFIYSADLAALTVWVMREYHSPDPITLSVDESAEVPIKDVALAVAKAMKFEGEVVFDTDKADGQFKKTACNKKLRGLKPEYDFVSMEDGIQKSVDWFVENYETARK